jgi:hypothetical protein
VKDEPGARPSDGRFVWHSFWSLRSGRQGVPMGVLAASRPSGACLTLSWPATAVAVAWSPEWTAHLAGWEWRPRGAARAVRAANARMVGEGAMYA